jgi:hypothetical protein
MARFRIWLATGHRVKYRVAARAHRQASAVAAKAAQEKRLSQFDQRVLSAVLVLTASFSKTDDRIATVQVAAFVFQLHVDSVNRKHRTKVGGSLRRLHDGGVITYEPGDGRGRVGTIRLPVPPEDNDVLRELGITGKAPVPKGDLPVDKGHPVSEKRSPQSGSERSPHRGLHTEKVTEKETEERERALEEETSSSGVPTSAELLDRERDESLGDEGEPEDLTSQLASALRANGTRLAGKRLERECDAAVRRARHRGLADDVIAKCIGIVAEAGEQYPSALDKKLPAAPKSWDPIGRAMTRASSADGSTVWRDSIPHDVQPVFEKVKKVIGVELEPSERLVELIRANVDGRGVSVTHLAGELQPGQWPDPLHSPEGFAIKRLGELLGGAA